MSTIRTPTAKTAALDTGEAEAIIKRPAVSQTSNYALDASHNREFHQLGGTITTVTLPTVSSSFTETDDWFVDLRNNLTTPITIARNSQNINGAAADVILHSGSTIRVRMDAATAAFYTDTVQRNPSYTTKTANFSVASEHHNQLIGVSTSGGAVTATLLAAASAGAGFIVSFIVTDATNVITIDGNSSETINGATTITLNRINDRVTLMCDGSNWKIIEDGRSLRGCLVYLTADKANAAVDATSSAVAFNTVAMTEAYDTDSIHEGSTNPSRFTIPAGVYVVNCTATLIIEGNATGRRDAEIKLNGSSLTPPALNRVLSATTTNCIIQVATGDIKVTPGDYLELYGFQNSGGNLDFMTNSWFQVTCK